MVLSYYEDMGGVFNILQVLSHSTRAYCLKHKPQLESFVSSTRVVTKLPPFGNAVPKDIESCRYFEWPEQDYLADPRILRNYQPYKISLQISDCLRGFTMDIGNGKKQLPSPAVTGQQSSRGQARWRVLETSYGATDLSKFRISRIGLKVTNDNFQTQLYHGIRIYANNELIIDQTYLTYSGSWEY